MVTSCTIASHEGLSNATYRNDAAVQVRLSGEEFDSLENWRRAQEKIPPRSEAIREAIRRLVRPRTTRLSFPLATTSIAITAIQLSQKNTVRWQAGPHVNLADPIGET